MSVYIVVGTLHFNLEDTPTIVLSDRKLGQLSGAHNMTKPQLAVLVFPGAKYESIQALRSTHIVN